jgi:membrane protein YqaA with SNARE-associated domain
MGRLGKWEWIEKWLGISPEKLDKQRVYISKYGIWLALVAWLPFIGDVMVLGLGFYRTRRLLTYILLLVGKFLRYLFWTIVLTV